MSESLRRSSRRSKKRTFSVGHLVEIVSKDDIDNVVAKGRLLSKISDDPDYWLVEVDDGLQPNEEMDENRFGDILGKVEEPIAAPSTRHPPRSVKSSASSVNSTKESKIENSTKDQNKSITASELDQSHSSSSNGNGKTSKSKKINLSDPHASVPSSDASSSPTDQKTSLTHEQRVERRLNHPLREIPRPLKKQKVPKQKEDVVRIPMKTGVLLLYKGIRRRAEFVRKV